MKTIIFVLFAVLLTTSISLAAWQDTFPDDIAEKGLAATVAADLALGAYPDEIIDIALAAGVQAEKLVSAICDAGVPLQVLQDSLPILGLGLDAAMIACDIPTVDRFSGAGYSSASKKTDYDGGTPVSPASGHNFNR